MELYTWVSDPEETKEETQMTNFEKATRALLTSGLGRELMARVAIEGRDVSNTLEGRVSDAVKFAFELSRMFDLSDAEGEAPYRYQLFSARPFDETTMIAQAYADRFPAKGAKSTGVFHTLDAARRSGVRHARHVINQWLPRVPVFIVVVNEYDGLEWIGKELP